MTVQFPCSTKTALLIEYQNALNLYADSVGKLERKIAVVSRDKYESLRIVSEKAHRNSLKALEALDAHTEEHGC
jgi:hypothetical protein